MKKFICLIMIIPLGACSVFGYNAGVKEPAYEILKRDGQFEIRKYNSILLATTTTQGNFDESQDQSFQRLFDYISGENTGKQDIPMTAPVFMEPQSVNIPMTAPVFMEPLENQGWSMSFILPADYTLSTVPQPKDSQIKIEEKTNLKFAAIKFSGFFKDSHFQSEKQKLENWMKSQNLNSSGPAIRAGYNPPWTLPPLRRNEILIPLE